MSRRAALTHADLQRLVNGTSDDERAAATHKLCRTLDAQPLSPADRAAAEEVLRVLAADAVELVRRALAVTLRASTLLPRDVALRLAADVESVATPLLSFSPVFTDEDLMEVVRAGGAVRQIAVARRAALSQPVTAAMAAYGTEEALAIACANDDADFSERALQRTLERYPSSGVVTQAMAYRAVLPLSVAERLVGLVGDAARDHLVETHRLSPEIAIQVALGARERATVDLLEHAERVEDHKAFAAHLNRRGRLSASLLLRAAARGQLSFFEHGVAELAGVPHSRTWLMIHDGGPLGLKAICERAGLPARLLPAFRAAVETCKSVELDGGPGDRERFQQRVLQRFLTQQRTGSREDMDYLLERLDRAAAPMLGDCANAA
jgi:uncharacterized protein (DUF2336 family)